MVLISCTFVSKRKKYWQNRMICGFKIKIIIERKKLNSHPMINGKYLKTIIKSYNNKIAISFKNVKDISTKQT